MGEWRQAKISSAAKRRGGEVSLSASLSGQWQGGQRFGAAPKAGAEAPEGEMRPECRGKCAGVHEMQEKVASWDKQVAQTNSFLRQ